MAEEEEDHRMIINEGADPLQPLINGWIDSKCEEGRKEGIKITRNVFLPQQVSSTFKTHWEDRGSRASEADKQK